MGPQFSLRSLRRVPDSAQCVHYATQGNIEGLRDLFGRGLASPWDVSSTRGYTLSRVGRTIVREARSLPLADIIPRALYRAFRISVLNSKNVDIFDKFKRAQFSTILCFKELCTLQYHKINRLLYMKLLIII